jgi:hypothetical protein
MSRPLGKLPLSGSFAPRLFSTPLAGNSANAFFIVDGRAISSIIAFEVGKFSFTGVFKGYAER